MSIKSKIALTLLLILIGVGILYLTVDFLFPRDFGAEGTINKNASSYRLEKSVQDNHYYISFLEQQNGNKKIKVECTKEQYDFLNDEKQDYHLTYKKNFFNRSTGKITKLDNKPIYDGIYPIALYKELKISTGKLLY